jgi:adenylate cyclase
MTTDNFQRKLTAIQSADVAGYSRLMGEDEEATVRTLNKYKEIIFDLIKFHHGRLVDSPGDNVLAEFVSVVDAVKCAVQIQKDLKASNEALPQNRKMEFRIGINIGDVIQDGDRIYGDGVNVAARIESLADPGGICISRTAYDQVKNKINIEYDYLGEYEVKNIKDPVRVYKILMRSISGEVLQKGKVYETFQVERKPPLQKEKPSIAVLPFLNLSSDPEQEYFVDGLTEEILNSLAQIPNLTVIARTSSFSFRGSDRTIHEIADVLGVENILEGSVRKAGNTLRITTQLIKGNDGAHLWSETYNREVKDIFKIQEDIANNVADKLKLTLEAFNLLGGTESINAYELYLKAKGERAEGSAYSVKNALKSINSAIDFDPKFALAWSFKSYLHGQLCVHESPKCALKEADIATKAAQRAIDLESNIGNAYINLGHIKLIKSE